jgi:hypothetical protein
MAWLAVTVISECFGFNRTFGHHLLGHHADNLIGKLYNQFIDIYLIKTVSITLISSYMRIHWHSLTVCSKWFLPFMVVKSHGVLLVFFGK